MFQTEVKVTMFSVPLSIESNVEWQLMTLWVQTSANVCKEDQSPKEREEVVRKKLSLFALQTNIYIVNFHSTVIVPLVD
jgi:hypothetical protein